MTAIATAVDPNSPADERRDAFAELTKSYAPRTASDLIPPEHLGPVIDYINESMELQKAGRGNVVIPFPGRRPEKRGAQSLFIDDLQVFVREEYYERQKMLDFDSMRAMVDQTPLLQSIIMTRIRQAQQFCRVSEDERSPGFLIKHKDKDHQITDSERESVKLLQSFMLNCGWESNPRRRSIMRRDSMTQFMTKLVRDTLTLDAASIETEMKRDKRLGIDGIYAIDGGTIRLCSEEGYHGDDEIFAVQVVNGVVRTTYDRSQLIYVPRNPSSDIRMAGYGLSEVETLIKVVTSWLNTMTYNMKFFDSNSIPKGMLHLTGNFTEQDLNAFKRIWNGMVKGVNNAWSLPVMVSKDQESKASFERFGVEVNEMMFARFITWLTSIACSIFGMDPAEISHDSFSAGTSSLSGSDTAERLAMSKDKGLKPLMAYFESLFSDYIISDFSDDYVFRFVGLSPEDEDKRHELRKLVLTVNEIRAEEGYDKMDGPIGDAPVNPALLSAWQQAQQAQNQDFGNPGAEPPAETPPDGQDFGDGQSPDFGDADQSGAEQPGAATTPDQLGKAFGLPTIYTIE